MKWVSVVKEDLDADCAPQIDSTDRKHSRRNVFDWRVGQREKRKKMGTVWSNERKSSRCWAQIKPNLSRR